MTREVWRRGGDAGFEGFACRISIADVTAPGPFSTFGGYRRLICLIAGGSMNLRFADDDRLTALHLYQPFAFDGARALVGELPCGPVCDLNVIYQPEHLAAALYISRGAAAARTPAGGQLLLINLGLTPLLLDDGQQPFRLQRHDALLACRATLDLPSDSIAAVITVQPI